MAAALGEALFFDELEARAAELGGVSIRRFDSGTGARIDLRAVEDDVGGPLAGWSWYLRGPKPLVADIAEGLKARSVPARHIHNEEFEPGWRTATSVGAESEPDPCSSALSAPSPEGIVTPRGRAYA